MKKIIAIIFACIFSSICLYADIYNEVKSLVIISSRQNFKNNEDVWIDGVVADKLKENMHIYTDFNLIDNTNQTKIKNLQRQSENASFDEDTILEVGKLTTASHALFIKITKTGSTYTLTANISNLTTAKLNASVISSSRKNIDDLYNTNDCAVNEITLKLCDALDIYLSGTQKYVLQHGNTDLSNEERINLNKAEVERFNKQISDLDKQIISLSQSTELDAAAKKAQLEAERLLAQEKLKSTEETQKRIQEAEKKRIEYEKEQINRSEEQKKHLTAVAEELNEKVKTVRSYKMQNKTQEGQIGIIELKKKALLEIRNNVEIEKQLIVDKANKEIASIKEEIVNCEYKTGQTTATGQPLESVVSARNKKFETEKEKIEKIANEDTKLLEKSIESQEKEILDEINNDYQLIKKIQVLSTLGDSFSVSFGGYDGSTAAWELFIYVTDNGITLFKEKAELPYKTVTGNKPVMDPLAKGYENYLEEVDFYQSLFYKGEPILVFELDSSVCPLDKDKPSQYEFEFSNLRFYKMEDATFKKDGTIIAKRINLPFENHSVKKSFTPSYDMRSKQELEKYNLRSKQELEKLEKIEKRKIANSWAYEDIYACKANFGIFMENIVNNNTSAFVGGFVIDFPLLQNVYLETTLFPLVSEMNNCDFIDIHDDDNYDDDYDDWHYGFTCQIGLNKRIHIGQIFHPNIFISGGYLLLSNSSPESQHDYSFIGSLGIDIPINRSMAFSLQYSLYNDICSEPYDAYTLAFSSVYTKEWKKH